jgi:hypothetical protein
LSKKSLKTSRAKRRFDFRHRNFQRHRLTPYDPELAEQMKIAEQVMREDRDALRKLAE